MDLKEERAIGGDPAAHWYYISQGRAILSLLEGRRHKEILDVGAGSGVFSRMLMSEGAARMAVCVDPLYSNRELAAGDGERLRFVRSVESSHADLVLMIGVIEHADDDVAFVARYAQMAAPGTTFLLSAPAFDFLWSSEDDYLEHRRRYTLESLEATVGAAGLEPVRLRYFHGMLFPAVAALRIAGRALKGDRKAKAGALKAAPKWLTSALVSLHDVECAALFPVNRLAGVTAFCLARKPAALAVKADAA